MIPQNIYPYFKKVFEKMDGDNTFVEGILTCCNATDFEVYISGEVKHSIFSKIYLSSEDDKVVLEARCKKCGKHILVFDSYCNGYGRCGKMKYEFTKLKPIACKKCKDNDFSIVIRYEYPDVQELEELGINEMDNAFTWIWITLECNKCGTKYRNFVEFETA